MAVAGLLLGASVSAQTPASVDLVRGGVTIYSGPTITDTLSTGGAVAGDQVLIKAPLDSAGNVIPYSEDIGEVFPIQVPSGVVVENAGSHPVYVVSIAPGGASALFQVGAIQGPDPTEVTTFRSLHLAGARIAIEVVRDAGGATNLLLDDVRFLRNGDALVCRAGGSQGAGGTIGVSVEDCWIVDDVPYAHAPQPAEQKFSRGFVFQVEDFDAGTVSATIDDLRTYGQFPDSRMARVPVSGQEGTHDLEPFAPSSGAPSPELTRLVEIHAHNLNSQSSGEHDTSYDPVDPVPRVFLTVNGGVWNGRSGGTSNGWDVGLYADAEKAPRSTLGMPHGDYGAVFEASLNGTMIRNFRAAGIYARANWETRGRLSLQSVTIRDVGQGYAVDPNDDYAFLHNGVHAVSDFSYLVVEADNSSFLSNAGNGIYLQSHRTDYDLRVQLPAGAYLGLDHCEIHENGVNGLFLDAAPNKSFYPYTGGALVGGTVDYFGQQLWEPNLTGVGQSANPALPRGQGVVDGCGISNNGKRGIVMRALGRQWPEDLTAVSVRFVNTYVWGHPLEGWYARLEEVSPPGYFREIPVLLAPVVHCTFAYNDDRASGGATAEVEMIAPGGTPVPLFFWDDTPSDPNDDVVLITSFVNSVFQRPVAQWEDFGTSLQGVLKMDDNQSHPYYNGDPMTIGWSGIRSVFGALVSDPESTSDPSPFVGPIQEPSTALEQFFLDNLTGSAIFFQSPVYRNAGKALDEDGIDVEGYQRPGPFEARDKGGEED